MKEYKLNDKLVIRDDEMTIFSIENMKIYEFNEDGFKIINTLIDKNWQSINEIIGTIHKEYCIYVNREIMEEIESFLDELVELKVAEKRKNEVLIQSENIIIREWKKSDVYDLYEYAQSMEVAENAGWKKHENINESKKIVELFIEEGNTYAIELICEKKVIGSIGLHQIADDFSERIMGIVVSPYYQRKGIASEAVKLLVEYAFENEKIDKIFGKYFTFNYKMENFLKINYLNLKKKRMYI